MKIAMVKYNKNFVYLMIQREEEERNRRNWKQKLKMNPVRIRVSAKREDLNTFLDKSIDELIMLVWSVAEKLGSPFRSIDIWPGFWNIGDDTFNVI